MLPPSVSRKVTSTNLKQEFDFSWQFDLDADGCNIETKWPISIILYLFDSLEHLLCIISIKFSHQINIINEVSRRVIFCKSWRYSQYAAIFSEVLTFNTLPSVLNFAQLLRFCIRTLCQGLIYNHSKYHNNRRAYLVRILETKKWQFLLIFSIAFLGLQW